MQVIRLLRAIAAASCQLVEVQAGSSNYDCWSSALCTKHLVNRVSALGVSSRVLKKQLRLETLLGSRLH